MSAMNEYTRRVLGAMGAVPYHPPVVFGDAALDWWWSQLIVHWDWYVLNAEKARQTANDYRQRLRSGGGAPGWRKALEWALIDLDKNAALMDGFSRLRAALEARDSDAVTSAIHGLVEVMRWPGERWGVDYFVMPPSSELNRAWYTRYTAYVNSTE